MNKKERIADAYRKLVISKNTTKITVKEICQKSHISRTTFYNYFKDYYEIIEYTFIEDSMIPLDIMMNNGFDTQVIVLNWYLSFYKNKEFYLIAIKDYGQNSFFDTIIKQLEKYNITFLKDSSYPLTKQDINYHAYKEATTQAMLLKKWMNEGMEVTPEQMTDYYIKRIIQH